MASQTKSIAALLTSIFVSPLGLEGYVFLRNGYGGVGKFAKGVSIAKTIFFISFIALALAAAIEAGKNASKNDPSRISSVKKVSAIGGAYLASGAILGFLGLLGIIAAGMSFSKIKK